MTGSEIIPILLAALELAAKAPAILEKLRQNAELTPDQEAQLDSAIAALPDKPHWKV